MLVLLLVGLWFILRGDLLYVFPCVILFLCFPVLLVLRLPRLGKRELILVLFVRLFGLCLFRFVVFFSSSWGLGRAAVCDCGTPWTFLLLFCSTDRSKAVVPVLVFLFVALCFILRGDLLYVFPCVILFLCFTILGTHWTFLLPFLNPRWFTLLTVLIRRSRC